MNNEKIILTIIITYLISLFIVKNYYFIDNNSVKVIYDIMTRVQIYGIDIVVFTVLYHKW